MPVPIRVALAVTAALGASGLPAGAGSELFLHDAREAFAAAEKSGRPILIDFRTTWCVACREMDRSTWRDEEVRKLLARYVALEVDGDRDVNLTARYGVDAYPTIVIAASDGAPILSLLGYQDAPAMRAHLEEVAESYRDLSRWAHEAERRRGDPTALLSLAEFARRHGASDQAEELYRRVLRRRRDLGAETADRARIGLASILIDEGECREARKLAGDLQDGSRAEPLRERLARCR